MAQDADMLTTAFGMALFWGLFFGARIPIALAALVVGLVTSVLLVVILYGIGVIPASSIAPSGPDLTGWLPRLLSGIATFVALALLHVWRQRWEGRPGW